jgi:hypothetical protein
MPIRTGVRDEHFRPRVHSLTSRGSNSVSGTPPGLPEHLFDTGRISTPTTKTTEMGAVGTSVARDYARTSPSTGFPAPYPHLTAHHPHSLRHIRTHRRTRRTITRGTVPHTTDRSDSGLRRTAHAGSPPRPSGTSLSWRGGAPTAVWRKCRRSSLSFSETPTMRGRRPQPMAIVPEDDEPLRRLARSHAAPWFQVRRARIDLAIGGGGRVQAIAGANLCDPSTVRRICLRYRRLGLDGLLAPPRRPGRLPRIFPPAAGPDRPTRLPGADLPRAARHPLE